MKENTEPQTPQPGSIFMTVNAFYRPEVLVEKDNPDRDFTSFIHNNVKYFNEEHKYLPDH